MIARTAGLASVAFAAALACAGTAVGNGIVVEAPGAPAPGARTPRGAPPVVLVAHRVHAKVEDRVAEVEVEQVFRNRLGVPLEGVYLFPLPEGAVVHRFAMTIGGRLVEGEVLAADRAREVYEGIVRRRLDPGLLEYAGRGLYRARVFPIEPRGEVRVRLTFQEVLAEDAGTLELRYPLATDRMNGEPVAEVSVVVDVASPTDLKTVYCPSHDVSTKRPDERTARVAWSRTRFAADRDFVLYLGRCADAVGLTLVSHRAAGEDGTFFAVLAPRVDPSEVERAPKDVVFVLDASGSMEGQKLAVARRAVTTGIDLLRPGDRFAAVVFSSTVMRFCDAPVEATPENRAAARAWLEARPALGGTDLDGALRAALALGRPGRLTLVVLVTDGKPTVGVTDADEIVARANAVNPARARVFTFGVGVDLDVGLLDRVAEGTGGARDYVTGDEDLELATGRFYAKVERPALTDVTVDLGDGVYDVYPARIPDLFAGGQVVLFGRYRHAGPRAVRVGGNLGGRPVAFEMRGALRDQPGPAYVARLWAQRKVAYLLDQIRLHGADGELVHEVEDLGTRFGLVTPYTSGLVVEDEAPALPPPHGALGSRSRRWSPGGSVPPGLREPADPVPPPPPSSPPSVTTPPTTTPPDATAASKRLRDRKEASSEEDASGRVRVVDGRAFVRDADGRWVDVAWDRRAAPRRVEAFSPAYFEVAARSAVVARILALGERVVFVDGGEVVEIVPPPASPR